MEFIILDLSTATEEQLKATIDCNNRTYRMMSSEIVKLKKVSESTKRSIKSEEVEPVFEEKEEKTSIDKDFEHEVEYYYQALKELREDELDDEIETVLPSKRNYQYQRIMYRLKAEVIRSIKEIRDFLKEEGLSLEAADLENEMALELKRLNLLDQELSRNEQVTEEEVQVQNNLVFAPTLSGNIRILDEMEHIDPEYYERFAGLFQSIIDGTFKNVQRFSRNSDLAGLCEVKDFKTRVVFKRLDKNTYAVISAFIKKSDNDKGYRNMLSSRYSDYLQLESSLKKNLANEEFVSMQKLYTEELFNMIAPEQLTPQIKIKGGE